MSDSAILHHTAPALLRAVELWADSRTAAVSPRRHDLLRDKVNALLGDGTGGSAAGFFTCVRKSPEQVTALDVNAWQVYLEEMGLAHSTIYARISRVSSFYSWLMQEPAFRETIRSNPVDLARPKAPAAYQNEQSQSLTDDDAAQLLRLVQAEAAKDNLNAKRDYALLRFYFATGKRRSEIINLRWRDIRLTKSGVIIQTEEKGSLYRSTEIRDPGVIAAFRQYLQATDRWTTPPSPDDPVWLRHDRAAKGQEAITSHGFVKSLKKYAKQAGIGDIHLHQTRHTVARLVGEESGSIAEVQAILGHQSSSTTRIYLERLSVKKDRYSEKIASRLGLDD